MFPLQPMDELVFGTGTTFQGDQILGDLIADQSFMEGNYNSFSTSCKNMGKTKHSGLRKRKRRGVAEQDYAEQDSTKMLMHRDVERKRREHMSNLYASLRSSLPQQHNKGKSPVSDDIREAVDYIKQMQDNIQELSIRRDKLKKRVETCDEFKDSVMVKQAMDGLEILVSRSFKSSEFGISGILAELQEIDVQVVSCVSTRTQGGFLHKIHAEARDMTSLDAMVLQDRLSDAIK